MDEQTEFVRLITRRLESAGIASMLTGSTAMAFYAVPRMTRDVDFIVACEPGDAERIATLFESDCYVDVDQVRTAIATRGMFNIIHTDWVLKADFIVRKDDAYRRTEFARRRKVAFEGATVAVVTAEDLILSKLCWSMESGSQIQQNDARRLVEAAVDLDWPYLEKWAEELGVATLMRRVRSQ